MIAIKRKAAPDFLTDEASIWHQETLEAIAHYAVPGQTADFTFKRYNEPKLKLALKEVFLKCAYCDYNYRPAYDGDVEHFRPKGRVREKDPQKPGYYWLANDWDNLLLSCQHCNQCRKQLLEGDTDPIARGKLDQFPVSDPARRACRHSDSLEEDEEVRYLWDPCRDDPEEHLAYEDTEGVMKPLTDKGKHSIEVYVLQRVELVAARKMRLLEVMAQMEVVKDQLDRFNESRTEKDRRDFFKYLNRLFAMGADEAPFAGLARFFTRKFMQENALLLPEAPLAAAG